LRPMRPKPLIPTFVAISILLGVSADWKHAVNHFRHSQSRRMRGAR
jgi:hypothetical protein